MPLQCKISTIDKIIQLLEKLISIPSFSGQEDNAANVVEGFLREYGVATNRNRNNIWAGNQHFRSELPNVLLNSHIDTVKPNSGWTSDPFKPLVRDGIISGLGSNDAGGCLVSLIAAFLHFYKQKNLSFNLILVASAEEEISGKNGIESILPDLNPIDVAIVGEPTGMDLAIAEKGLMVLDCVAAGKSGHAARDVGENAIINAIKDIQWFHSYQFDKKSEFLGPIKMNVTMIEAGIQHNIIPDSCKFTVDVRTTDVYKNEEVLAIIKNHITSKITPRSTRLNSSSIDKEHLLVKAAVAIGLELFGSPTTSDQAILNAPSVKIGPGKSERSHTANEFILIQEIEQGINKYIELLEYYNNNLKNQK